MVGRTNEGRTAEGQEAPLRYLHGGQTSEDTEEVSRTIPVL